MSNEIKYTKDSTLGKAMRRVRRYYPAAYSKLLAMKWQWTNRTSFGCTDGRQLLLNPRGIKHIEATTNPVGYLAFLLVHEALHALLNHGSRLAELKDHETANESADYIINAMIAEVNRDLFTKLGYEAFPLIEGCLLDEALSGSKSVRELYTDLSFQKAKEDEDAKDNEPDSGDEVNPKPDDDEPDTPEGEGKKDDDDCDSEDGGGGGKPDDSDDEDGDTGNGGGSSSDKDEDGDAGSGGGSSDEDEDEDDDDSNDGGGQGAEGDDEDELEGKSDKELLEGFAGSGVEDTFKPEVTEEDKDNGLSDKDMKNEIDKENEKIILTEQMDEMSCGDVGTSGLREVVAHREKSEGMRWDEYLSEWLTARTLDGWNKPFNNVIYGSTKLVCAGRGSNSLNELVIGVDVSGSISDIMLAKIMGSIEEAMEVERPVKVHIVAFSHYITDHVELDQNDPVPTSMHGGGGTAFQPVWDWVDENAPDCDGIVMLTDMYAFDFMKGETTTPVPPVLFISYGLKEMTLPFGELVPVTLD